MSIDPENSWKRNEEFRDTITTISRDGNRNFIYPKKPKGKHYNARTWFGYFLLIFFISGPFLKYNNHNVFLFNIIERKFILFGLSFWPQDFYLVVLIALTFVIFITLFTVMFGRLWCGWACPQTIFMEIIFRKIEYLIDGDFKSQKALKNAPLTFYKGFKRVLKHSIFYSISLIISIVFIAYIIGGEEVLSILKQHPFQNKQKVISVLIFSGVFYGVYARFREQVCLVVCPYGRLQGVLLDPNSIVIGYDYNRGEPRGKINKKVENTNGDCVDCNLCVQVCPTGIDIRNGTQLECINCTACIDACNQVMDKIYKPRGLIRYTSENAIAKGQKFTITTRIISYSIVLVILTSSLVYFVSTRSDIDATILRTPGLTWQNQGNDNVSNLYNIKLINKTFDDQDVVVEIIEPKNSSIKWVGKGLSAVKSQNIAEGELFMIINTSSIKGIKTPIKVVLKSKGKIVKTIKTSFLGPQTK